MSLRKSGTIENGVEREKAANLKSGFENSGTLQRSGILKRACFKLSQGTFDLIRRNS